MKLVIGGSFQGKKEYVFEKYIANSNEYVLIDGMDLPEKDIIQDNFGDYLNFVVAYALSEQIKSFTQNMFLIINNYHLIVKNFILRNHRQINEEENVTLKMDEISNLAPGKIIIISDEIGNGIVPLEKQDRIYRELVGRSLVQIAKDSDSVERIICGIPQQLK